MIRLPRGSYSPELREQAEKPLEKGLTLVEAAIQLSMFKDT